jgi:phage regulator Rha-like protein
MKTERIALSKEIIESKIYYLRGKRVMLDFDLAELYEVETRHLKRQVNRHLKRFPADFMLVLTSNETKNLRCQIGTSSHGGTRYSSFAFTQEGVAMLSSVLNSEKAIEVNIHIMRAFVKLRSILSEHKGLREKLEKLEQRYDHQFKIVFEAIKQLMCPQQKGRRQIGFHPQSYQTSKSTGPARLVSSVRKIPSRSERQQECSA